MKIQKPLTVSAPGGAETVLLHTCCAPCSSAIIECLMRSGIRPTIYYCNPNIYPLEEYLIRKDECTRYASAFGLDIVDADYDHSDWLQWVRAEAAADGCGAIETERERGGRCLECFKYRLLKSAEYALEHGFSVLTTTLASSRWKSLEQIDKAGKWAVERALASLDQSGADIQAESGSLPESRLVWWEQNWRKGGLQERRGEIIREYGFYNQTWCGCEFSQTSPSSCRPVIDGADR